MTSTIRLLGAIGLVWVASASHAAAMQIVAPAAGTVLSPGASVLVRVTADPAEQLSAVAVAIGGQSLMATPVTGPATFEATLTVPLPAVGPAFIIAIGTSSSGVQSMDFVQVTVDPGPLRRLFIAAPSGLTRVGQVFQVKVTGSFEDGVTRDLTLPQTGTTYSTSDAAILGVDPTGLIQARRKGIADLIVSNRGNTTIKAVTLAVPDPPDNRIPVPNPGPDRTVTSESVVTLSAVASGDPDGDPLTYRWHQESGRFVTLTKTDGVDLQFIAPNVTTIQTLTFSLMVRDNKGAESLPALVHVTVQP